MLKFISLPFLPVSNWQGVERVYVFSGYRYKDYVTVCDFSEVPNSSDNPSGLFSVTSSDLLKVVSSLPPKMSVLGFAHTHPDNCPKPSAEDIEGIGADMFGVVLCGSKQTWYDNTGVIKPKLLV